MSFFDANPETTAGLDRYFELNNSIGEPSAFISMSSSNYKFSDLRTTLFNVNTVEEIRKETEENFKSFLDEQKDKVSTDPELLNIIKYTKQGADKLRELISDYITMLDKEQSLKNAIESMYKNRNQIIHDIRLMSKGAFMNEVEHVSNEVETYVKKMVEKHEDELKEIETRLEKIRAELCVLSEVYCIQRNVKPYSCPICYANECSLYCNPCGHVFCNGCLKADYCPICRAKIIAKGRLFL